jgi:putative acetyltransferase
MHLRRYQDRDAVALAEIFRRAVVELGPRHYSAEQVAAWAADAPDEGGMRRRGNDGRSVLVAADASDRPVAFADLEADGHIDLLFVLPEAAGTGIAGALLEAIETVARTQGLMRLTVEASEAAKGLFARHGFAMLGRRDFELGGVMIHNYAMEKLLQRQTSSHVRLPARG